MLYADFPFPLSPCVTASYIYRNLNSFWRLPFLSYQISGHAVQQPFLLSVTPLFYDFSCRFIKSWIGKFLKLCNASNIHFFIRNRFFVILRFQSASPCGLRLRRFVCMMRRPHFQSTSPCWLRLQSQTKSKVFLLILSFKVNISDYIHQINSTNGILYVFFVV